MPGGRRVRAALATIVALAALAGCAGGGPASRRSVTVQTTLAPARRPSSPPFRWLVRTQGPQPDVALENREPGTRAWRLPGPRDDVGGLARGDVSGYVSEEAVSPGQVERIYVSAPGSKWIRITLFRIGWYGGAGGREVLASDPLRAHSQPPCIHRDGTGFTECDWHPTLTFTIPPALPTGVYVGRLSARTGESDCLFVVRASLPQPLIAQLPTSTYQAYNSWGGDSLYPGGDPVGITGTTQGVAVSFDRPYGTVTGAGQFFARDVAMIWFLERYGYPVSYTTSESVDEYPDQLLGHRAVIDFGHSEYWSQRQADAFTRARDAGESLLFLGSDTMAWRVRYAAASRPASAAGQADHAIVAYKEHAALDPDLSEPTGPFPDDGASLTGSAYLGCIDPRLNGRGPPAYRYYAWSPARALAPRWLFAGTHITPTTRIPGIVGYEVDMRTPSTPAGTRVIGSGTVQCMGTEIGEPRPGPGQNLAQTTIYTARSGAIVFNTGTLGWELGLEPVPSAGVGVPRRPDPRVVRMTRNLLAYVLHRAA